MTRKSGLGRGLDALILGDEHKKSPSGVLQVHVDRISPNPRQPRSIQDPQALKELSESIKEHGILQPLIVTLAEEPDQYVLVAGERRWLAARQAGEKEVPVIVREATDSQRLELALIENLQRTDLNPLEAAEAYNQLSEDFDLSHQEIAQRVGKSRTAVTNTLRLLNLSAEVRRALVEDRISEGHARALLSLSSKGAQSAVLATVISQELNVRQTEALVRKWGGDKPVKSPKTPPSPEIQALEDQLRSSLGTKVRINRSSKGGTLVIYYYSNEELDAIIDRITT